MDPGEYGALYRFEEGHWWYRALHELVLAFLAPRLRGPDREIFDAGCGTGLLMSRLAALGGVRGADRSRAAVAYCRKRGLDRVAEDDLNALKLESGSLDAITCIDVLYHEDIRDERAVLGAFFRGLKPGGVLIIDLPAFDCLWRAHDRRVHGARRYRKGPFSALLGGAGFRVELASYRLPLLFLLILLRKPFERAGAGPRSDLGRVREPLNRLLLGFARLGNRLILAGVPLPFGSSLFVVARKPGDPAPGSGG